MNKMLDLIQKEILWYFKYHNQRIFKSCDIGSKYNVLSTIQDIHVNMIVIKWIASIYKIF